LGGEPAALGVSDRQRSQRMMVGDFQSW